MKTEVRYRANVRTTLVLNDDLYREVKVLAATRGVTATSLVEEGLREVLRRYRLQDAPSLPMFEQLSEVQQAIDLNDGAALRALLDDHASIVK